jgi:hypothetical protein
MLCSNIIITGQSDVTVYCDGLGGHLFDSLILSSPSAHDVWQTVWLLLFTSGAQKNLIPWQTDPLLVPTFGAKQLRPSQTDSPPLPTPVPRKKLNTTKQNDSLLVLTSAPRKKLKTKTNWFTPGAPSFPRKETYYGGRLIRSASVPWNKLNCITNRFTLGAHLCPLKEIQLYYELIRSWCPPPPHERNLIVLRID